MVFKETYTKAGLHVNTIIYTTMLRGRQLSWGSHSLTTSGAASCTIVHVIAFCVHRNNSGGDFDYNGVFTPEQDTDKTTTRQMLNLCIPMMPFTPGWTCLV